MRERTLFNSMLFKGVFVLVFIAVTSLSFYWNWGLVIESESSSWINLTISNSYVEFVVKLVLLVISILLSPFIGRKFKLIERNTKTNTVFLILLFVFLSAQNFSLNTIISAVIIQVHFYYFLKVYNQVSIRKVVFLASLLISFLTFLCIVNAIFLLVFWIGISIVRPFSIRDYFVSSIAFLIPIVYYYSGLFILDLPFPELNLSLNLSANFKIQEYIFIGFALLAGLDGIRYQSKMIVHQRNQITFLLLIALTTIVFAFTHDQQYLMLTALPVSIFVSNLYHTLQKKWILDGLALVILLLIPFLKMI